MTIQEATEAARKWAETHQSISVDAAAALAYIQQIPENRLVGKDCLHLTPSESDKTQYIYILTNLQSWRGEEAREAKKIMREYIKGG